ncbi:hypothetical protein R1sor_004224 [Riccia sorocarpa]|uniref:Ataxin-2 C-terminal domain-containing protein n=1 Tax=Riccia sorocarpa TaxID=122646 RepID=A0ABD3H6Q4_9MARC
MQVRSGKDGAPREQEFLMCYHQVTMASKPPIKSTLNPNAPAFVPAAYLAAEDFSPEWWRLIQTCPSFREYWLRERQSTEEREQQAAAEADAFDDIDDLLELGIINIQLDALEETQQESVAPTSLRAPAPSTSPSPLKQADVHKQSLDFTVRKEDAEISATNFQSDSGVLVKNTSNECKGQPVRKGA